MHVCLHGEVRVAGQWARFQRLRLPFRPSVLDGTELGLRANIVEKYAALSAVLHVVELFFFSFFFWLVGEVVASEFAV